MDVNNLYKAIATQIGDSVRQLEFAKQTAKIEGMK